MQLPKAFISGLLLLSIAPGASAQNVVQASSVTLQPQVSRDDIGFNSCGVRAIVIDAKPGSMDAYDFTLAIRNGSIVGMIKAGKANTTNESMIKGKPNTSPVRPGPINFWIAKESEGKSLRPLKIIPADTPGMILGATELTMTAYIMMGIMDGERMQFSTKFKNEQVETVVAFARRMPENERQPLLDCLHELVDRMKMKTEN